MPLLDLLVFSFVGALTGRLAHVLAGDIYLGLGRNDTPRFQHVLSTERAKYLLR